jgi:hypothetical protein
MLVLWLLAIGEVEVRGFMLATSLGEGGLGASEQSISSAMRRSIAAAMPCHAMASSFLMLPFFPYARVSMSFVLVSSRCDFLVSGMSPG